MIMTKVKKVWVSIKGAVSKAFALSRQNSAIAVEVTSLLKTIVESNLVATIVGLTPTKVDDVALVKLRSILPRVFFQISTAHNLLVQFDKGSDALGAFIEHLKVLHPEGRKTFWVSFAGELNVALSDGELSFAEGVKLSQELFEELYGKK